MAPFQLQQRDFVVNAPSITCKVAVCAHHAMAGQDDTDGVPTHRATYCLRRHFSWFFRYFERRFRKRLYDAFRNIAVGHGFPERYLSHDIQHRFAEWRQVFHAVGWCEIGLTACEIDIQPTTGIMDYGR